MGRPPLAAQDVTPGKPTAKARRNKDWTNYTYKDHFAGFTGQSEIGYGRQQLSLSAKKRTSRGKKARVRA